MATKKSPPKKTTAAKTQEDTFTVTLTLGEQVFTAEASDPTEAILALKPPKIVTKGVFTLQHNGLTSSLMKQAGMTRRFLSNKMSAFILGRNLQILLK